MLTPQVGVWVDNRGAGVSQWAAETMGIWEDKGGLTTQWMDNKVRERVLEIAQSMNIINMQGAGPRQWDLLIDHCITRIRDLASKRPLWKWYTADKTNINCQKLKAALDECTEGGLRRRQNRLKESLTKKWTLVQGGMYFIAPMLHLIFLTMCRYRR